MGQSLVKNYVHIIFSTKHHTPFINEGIENELHSYLAGICKALECYPVKIGGYKDHVHILCLLSKKITLIKFMEELKSSSSAWMKKQGKDLEKFYWQDGYGSFSVNPKDIDNVAAYINSQKEHHTKKTFKEEYRELLEKHEIEYDERYLWD